MSENSQKNARILIWGAAILALIFFAAGQWTPYWGLFFPGVGCVAAMAVLTLRGFQGPSAETLQAVEAVFSGNVMDFKDLKARDQADEAILEFARKAHQQRQKFTFLHQGLSALTLPLLYCDDQGRVIFANQGMCDAVRKKPDQVQGERLGHALFGQDGATPLEKAVQDQTGLDEELTLRLWNGKDWHVQAHVAAVPRAQQVRGFMVLFVDMQALSEQKNILEEQNKKRLLLGEEINELSQRVASASEELSASADEQARGAKQQKEQTDSVATAMEEMAATVLEVAKNSSSASQAADEARDAAQEGVGMVEKAVSGINSVSGSAQELAQVLTQLNEQAASIGKIINVINDIADQTNLLALNAAIEAARAGDAGRGFAVVADEVRKLAEKTMTATKEVEDAVMTIQGRSKDAMASMETTKQAGTALKLIMQRVEEVVSQVTQIATAAEQQSAAAEEINQSIEGIAQIAREADEGADQAAAATRDLAELAQELLSAAQTFSGGSDASKLAASEGQMKGVLPKLMQEYIKEKMGDNVYRRMQEEMGNPVFLPTGSYPDKVLHQMAKIASGLGSQSPREIMLGLGVYTVPHFYKMYRRYFSAKSLKEFYLKMNDIHAQLTKDHPGIKPPKFTYEDKGDVLFMNYRSSRGLFDYFEGILKSAANFMDEKVDIKVKPLDDQTARAEIRFVQKKS